MKTKIIKGFISGFMFLFIIGFGVYLSIQSMEDKVAVEWSTASELNTVGFNLYRSDTATGPGKMVNKDLIPASADTQTGGNYRFVDKGVIAGQVYYYFLEDVGVNGKTIMHGPVMVKVKSSGKIAGYLSIGIVGVTVCGILILILSRLYKNRIMDDERAH